MNEEARPRPWRLDPNARRIFVDANGRYVGSCFVDAASTLVVDAVNERDRLRADCERMREALEHIAMYDIEADYAASLAERALAACGAGETPKGKGVGV